MQVVLFCGGFGVRMRDYLSSGNIKSDSSIPKPMVKIGPRPLIWHIMNYYSHFGYNNFILALGYKADVFQEYFHKNKEKEWKVNLVDTGLNSNIGTRLFKLKEHIQSDLFFANYSDGLTDLDLIKYINYFKKNQNAIASFISVNPVLPFHGINIEKNGLVKSIDPPGKISNNLINAGYFIFKKEIFNYINEGEELVEEPLNRLAKKKKLISYHYKGFWKNIDNIKDKEYIDNLYNENNAPWVLGSKKRL